MDEAKISHFTVINSEMKQIRGVNSKTNTGAKEIHKLNPGGHGTFKDRKLGSNLITKWFWDLEFSKLVVFFFFFMLNMQYV